MTNDALVSADLLNQFDSLVDAGQTLPIDMIKQRLSTSDQFRYRDHDLYKTVIELPVTIGMILGDSNDAVQQIIAGLKALHGDELLFVFNHKTVDEVTLNVRMWRDEDKLRALWKDYAEDEYKTTVLSAVERDR